MSTILCLWFEYPIESESLKLSLSDAAYRFSPDLAWREDNHALFLDLTKSLSLYSPLGVSLRLRTLLRRFNLNARIQVQDSAGAALTRCHYDHNDPPIDCLLFYALPFSVDPKQTKQVKLMITQLKRLGIHSLHSFLKIPPKSLTTRFKQQGAIIAKILHDSVTHPWQKFTLPLSIVESMDLFSCENLSGILELEQLLFPLKTLCDRIASRVKGLGLRVSQLEVKLDERGYSLYFPTAQGSSAGLLPLIREKLSHEFNLAALDKPIKTLSVLVLQTTQAHQTQRHFFNSHDLEQESWQNLFSTLTTRLKPQDIFEADLVPHHLPEKSWVAVPYDPLQKKISIQNNHDTASRPSRLLSVPQPLLREGDSLVSIRSHQHFKIIKWAQTERISTVWWEQESAEPILREYFKVSTHDLLTLWVFNSPRGWFLHGYFD